MRTVYTKALTGIAVGCLFGLSAWGQAQPAKPNWKDRAEYDLYDAITKETVPAKKLELLNQWKQKYPTTDFKQLRQAQFLTTYQALNRGKDMLETAKEMAADDPNNVQALYWITALTISLNDTSPEALETGVKGAKGLLAALDTTFAPDKKPANVSEENWKKERASVESAALTALGWIAMQKKDNAQAEEYFTKSLQVNPINGQVSYWLGTVQLRRPETQGVALFSIARAAELDAPPPGGLPAPQRQQLSQYLSKVYAQYHGDSSGLDELKAMAKASALPPAGFKIKSAVEIATEKEEEFKRSNPMLALWMSIKKELAGPNGAQYFESSVKGAGLPGGAHGVTKFKGKVIDQKPATRPKEIILGISDATTPEVTLRLEEGTMPGKAEPGTEIEFEGVAAAFTPDPFMVTFDVERDKIVGWPAPAAPSAKKKAAPPAKKSAVKKK